jgi:predicted RNase H-like HicB family nuclease
MRYTAIYEKGETSWGAYVPDIPGVIAVGETREAVEADILTAVAFHVEGLQEEGLTVPMPTSEAGVLDVPLVA